MKTCPNCQTQYTDDTLRFCLQDGAELTSVTREPTVSLSELEMETVARQIPVRKSETSHLSNPSEVTHVSSIQPKAAGNSKTVLAMVATALGMLLIFSIVGVGLWLYFRDIGSVIVKNDNRPNAAPNSNADATPEPTIKPTQTPAANNNSQTNKPPVDINRGQIFRDVSQQIYSWRDDAQNGDLDSQMRKYAASVDYYQKRGASRDFIRADRARAYGMFDSFSITIDNMAIDIDESGQTATAAFDKEWVFDGERRSAGKVRQQLRFRSVNGAWLISGERDVSVYYRN